MESKHEQDVTEIRVGDRVRVEFWPMKSDLCGDVLYIPAQPGDSWIIRTSDRLFYVQHFATISKQIQSFPESLED